MYANNYGNINIEYISNSQNVFHSLFNVFKELGEEAYSKISDFIKNKVLSIQNEDITIEVDEFSINDLIIVDLIADLKNSFKEIGDILLDLDFEEEYYRFSSIRDMLFYILDNESLWKHMSLVKDLLKLV